MTLHLIRLPVDLGALARAAGDRGWTKGRAAAFDEGAALHHLLGETFGPAALQPFRLLVAARATTGNLYAYSTEPAESLAETAGAAGLPEAVAALSPKRMEGKPMPARWREGQRLGFDLRIRPVVRLNADIPAPEDRRRGRNHGFRKGQEVDAFLAAALRDHPDRRDGMEEEGRRREETYLAWLADRLAPAAEIEDGRLVRFRRSLAARMGRTQEGPDATVHGVLRITDPTAFADRLARGVGRHKAYGYGMLLLRPPGARAPRR